MKPTKPRWLFLLFILLWSLGGLWGCLMLLAQDLATVSGVVVDAAGPVAGARVRARATDNLTFSDDAGHFVLSGLANGAEIEVTAWQEGYYIAATTITPTFSGVTLTLRPYHTSDHPDYTWTSPISGTSAKACGNCHPMIVAQWISNAHGTAVTNPRFYSLYNGTDLSGANQVGPGYLNDFPDTAGNCASCHAPGAGVDNYLTTNMNDVRQVITAGIHCDYCHKVGGVYLNPATQSVYANAPGAVSQKLLRPPTGEDLFIGPYDDIPDPDTYLPLYHESQFCAACHQFSFWGTPIYESYEEWLNSPYAEAGITCQDCHMPPTGDSYYALPAQGGLPHPPETIPSHLQLGATAAELLQNTVTMTLSARQNGRFLQVAVTITNTGAGHHVPTDHPGRHLLLSVTAESAGGQPLALHTGPTIPDWGGNQAGQPGQIYAKILADSHTGEAPVVSYWKQTFISRDNRIPALAEDTTYYTFSAPDPGAATVSAQLLFRRIFQPLRESKGWDAPDIIMAQVDTSLTLQPMWEVFLPLVKPSIPSADSLAGKNEK